jgi:hypothetical protein
VTTEVTEAIDTLLVTAEDIAVARTLPVMWSPVESGVPVVFDFTDKRRAISTERYRRAMRAAEVLIHLGELSPGRYRYDNPFLEPGLAGQQPFIENGRVELRDAQIIVVVTADHLELMHALATSIADDGGRDIALVVHPKRPYGESTDFDLDIADILGIEPAGPAMDQDPDCNELSAAQRQQLSALHELMQPVMQVALGQATLAPGRFVRIDGRWGRTN